MNVLSKAVGSPWAWAAFFFTLCSFHIGRAVVLSKTAAVDPPPVLYEVPEFSLTDQFGKSFGTKQLAGKVWVANFVFTHCPTICDELTQKMAALQKRMRPLRDEAFQISFSVDPENDKPEVLATYAKKHEANPYRWRFLTGELGAVRTAVVGGFKLPMEKAEMSEQDALLDITHGAKFVLVDRKMQIRGYYDADEESIQKLLRDLETVAN